MKPIPRNQKLETRNFKQHGQKLVALLFWLALFGGYHWYAWRNDLSALEAVMRLIELLRGSGWGVLLFVAIYGARPLVLFPATLLSISAGLLFGPILGFVAVVIGSNLSASVAYVVGRFFGQDVLNGSSQNVIQSATNRLRRNSFEAVLMMRLLFLPYDLVNYLAGWLKIDYKAFLLATVLGSLPGTVAWVLAGSALQGADLRRGVPSLDWRVFAVSVAIFVASILVSRLVKQREQLNHE